MSTGSSPSTHSPHPAVSLDVASADWPLVRAGGRRCCVLALPVLTVFGSVAATGSGGLAASGRYRAARITSADSRAADARGRRRHAADRRVRPPG
ncbi:MAG: hypothetical protein MZV65_29730 [Chromatiales bacterium]|nr:hypothetical protein [Chromatiales bacterium]